MSEERKKKSGAARKAEEDVSTFFCRLSFYQLRNLSKIRKCLTQESSEIAVHAFITTKIDY